MSALVRASVLALLLLAAAAALACRSSGSGDGAAAGSKAAAPAGDAKTVSVTLSEWKLAADPRAVAPGKVSFHVKNTGSQPHELVVYKSAAAADKLALSGATVDEKKVAPLGRTATFDAGKSAELAVELSAGRYLLVCNIAGHYQLGMYAEFTVK
ncbi:MAG: hypothetical protein FJZ92_06755 [Chloroflexi bacterium]|nr:hypothetical protein [Chloroflexota bacterium]